MKALAVYVYSSKSPCTGDEAPYPEAICNTIEKGLLDSVPFMKGNDAWYSEDYLWQVQPESSEWAKSNNLEAGNLYFIDTENQKFLFKLTRFLITRTRVRDVMKLIWSFEYKKVDGVEGYIVNDPSGDSDGVWKPLPALAEEQFRSAYGNPIVSIFEIAAGVMDSILDSILPNVFNLIPWYAYVAAAGYTGFKTKTTLPGKPSLKNVGLQTYGYGAGTAFLLYRAVKSYEADKDREDNIEGVRGRRVTSRRRISIGNAYPNTQPQVDLIYDASIGKLPSKMVGRELTLVPKGDKLDFSPITSSNAAYLIFKDIVGDYVEVQEVFIVLLLNNRHKPIAYYRHSVGTSDSTVIDYKLVLAAASLAGAPKVMIAHNHPSGNLMPSSADFNATRKLKAALEGVNISLLDHIIITSEGSYSFADNGQL